MKNCVIFLDFYHRSKTNDRKILQSTKILHRKGKLSKFHDPNTAGVYFLSLFSVRSMSVLPVSVGALEAKGAKGAYYYHVPRLSYK